jgi:5-methylcytosine-specific restriction endonuclease McrA
MAEATFTCGQALALDCVVCGRSFHHMKQGPGRYPRFCSDDCKKARVKTQGVEYRDRARQGLRKHHYPSGVQRKRAPISIVCKQCGTSAIKGHSSRGNAFCSPGCNTLWWNGLRHGDREERPCIGCAKDFTPPKAGQSYCSNECRSRVWDAKKRARKRAAFVENVDPIAVFERDGWRCHLCGLKTMRSLRGTTDPLAPELDHILPLSRGGEHSYTNTACACRTCNQRKGAAVVGQMRLFG